MNPGHAADKAYENCGWIIQEEFVDLCNKKKPDDVRGPDLIELMQKILRAIAPIREAHLLDLMPPENRP